MTTLEISAEFGGRDAAEAVLPHFRALKRAAKLVDLPELPYPKLAFILRVAGEVNAYGEPGLDNLDIRDGEYLSLDIVLSIDDRAALIPDPSNPIAAAIAKAPAFLASSRDRRLVDLDLSSLPERLRAFASTYLEQLGNR